MKLATIVNARESITFASGIRLKSGARALRLRKTLLALDNELKAFDGMRNDYLNGIGKASLSPGEPGFDTLVKMISEAAAEDVSVTVEPVIELDDLESIEVSAKEIDGLVVLGLIRDL